MASSAAAAGASFIHNAAGALWTTQAKAAAEASTLTTAGLGMTVWQWNRAYYAYDSKQRWARFNFINNMAIAQTGQYREDIEDLASLTSNRMDNYHILGVMALTIATALFCPGRLGLHTPPPPSWLMGLFMCNLAGAYLWLGMTMWMAMHASLKADSAACHMLTRMVRLPIPTMRQLDRARRLFSSWEYQNFSELFRVPFLMRHATRGSSIERADKRPEEAEQTAADVDARSRARNDFDVPAWFRQERAMDQGRPVESFMPRKARGKAPEHFEVFRVIQCEYWPYDIYARVCMFLSWMHITSAWGYYQMGHTTQELRAMWAACIIVPPLFVTQNAMLSLDITTPKGEIFPWHRFGPMGYFPALIAVILEYQRWYNEAGLYISAFFVFLSYIFTIIFTVQMLRLCAPDDAPVEAHEAPGSSWWPAQWRIPSAWSHSTWLVAPPKEKAHGENDIVDELRKSFVMHNPNGESTKGIVDPRGDQKDIKDDVHRALGKNNEAPAWFFVRTGLQALLVAWIWLTFGYFIDIINEGTTHPSLINAPGLPNNLRDPRNRPPKPGYLCVEGSEGECLGQEVGTGGYYAGPVFEQIHKSTKAELDNGGHHRRLISEQQHSLSEKIRDLLPHLHRVIHDRDDSRFHPFGEKLHMAIESAPELVPARTNVEWPALFEPRLLACGPGSASSSSHIAVALSRHGRGALVTSTGSSTETTPFSLHGTAVFGPFLAAHWDEAGLMLTSSTGGFLECPGTATSGRWSCKPLAAEMLPLGLGREPFSGALAVARRHSKVNIDAAPELLSAVFFPGESTVAIFRRAAGLATAPWLPAGEARTPSQVVAASFHDNAESLLMLLADGSGVRMRLADGAMALAVEATSGPKHTWQATCGLANGQVARLGVKPSGPASWEPSLILGA